jgi:hypothetical protein
MKQFLHGLLSTPIEEQWTFFPSISRVPWLSGNAGSAMIIDRRVTVALRIRFVQYAAQGTPVSIRPRGEGFFVLRPALLRMGDLFCNIRRSSIYPE